jgi:hypothetical protein
VETRRPDCIRPTSAAEPLREPSVGLLGVLDPDSTACFLRGGNPSPSCVDARESGRPPAILIKPCIILALRRISSFSASVNWGSFFRGLFRLWTAMSEVSPYRLCRIAVAPGPGTAVL